MHIGFEAKRFFTNFTGLGNYARFVVDALSEFYPHDHYTLYSPTTRAHPEIDPIVRRSNVQVVAPTGGYRFLKGLWRSWGVSRHDTVKTLDVYHGLSQELPAGLPAGVKKVVTVHDLIYIRYPQFYKPVDVAIYKAKAKAACTRADRVIAISQQTAQDIVDFLHVDPRKIDVVYQGCHPIFKQPVSVDVRAQVRQKYDLPDRYILNVGTLESRKNAHQLVKALALLPQEARIPLVLVGRATAYKEEVVRTARESGIEDQLIFVHQASFQDFPALYQGAEVFVYPSLFEGFGIPLVEAIESGVPVITSTGSCFQEAAGDGALYADPHSAEALAHQLARTLQDATLRSQLVEAGRRYIQQFQPAVIAQRLQEVYRG
ncbi:glycosyltransferase family 4 protein [Parachryseolinea silvisoli]|jgi:glycosyltransferase involved in cell wall biosynthesis|uniref:glycosyltransferase family 4 protein n=1 Tax=Parachryseolinea silvisoli TaxID=2873601 RepID=UPI002265F87A|nr:glycosyltransferase family 1 protein [Parachryseolinea silvisoli]MCD9018340.1 glycosyltransferase family 4 protein [Parachryseolinea silvisoli]